jgi:polar amino acid transport system substrate-binding protein
MNPLAHVVAATALCLCGTASASAQTVVNVPHFRSPVTASATRPDTGPTVIRFLTAADYPPFQFIDADGEPAGFHADLARAICNELAASCTLQALKWDEIVPALKDGKADAIIAALRITPERRAELGFTSPYFRLPARFVMKRGAIEGSLEPAKLAGQRVAVVGGSAHEAFLRAFFPKAERVLLADAPALVGAVREGGAAAAFGDGAALSMALRAEDAAECCAFAGGPYLESHYFGEGLSIAVRPDDKVLRDLLDFALDELETRGVTGDLYLKWFPIGIY